MELIGEQEALGIYKGVGFKHGAWRDTGWWRLGLSDDPGAPVEPVPFAALQPWQKRYCGLVRLFSKASA